jgi:hypothetical protein
MSLLVRSNQNNYSSEPDRINGVDKMKISDRPNILPILAILEAEDLASRNRGDTQLLEASFRHGIQANYVARLTQMEALANERASFAFAQRSEYALAHGFFERANDLYLDYGADNKAAWSLPKSASSFFFMTIQRPLAFLMLRRLIW